MPGIMNGLQQRMLKENSRGHYFLCTGHHLNLVCQDTCTEFPIVSHVTSIGNKVVTFVQVLLKHCT